MSKDEPSIYVPMQEQLDTIKYADIQPSPYESPYQQDLYQEEGVTSACPVDDFIKTTMESRGGKNRIFQFRKSTRA